MTQDREALYIWTIYDHPRDMPHCYVARKFRFDQPTDDIIVCNKLDTLRRVMVERGLTCLARDPNDDPVIIETWL